MVLATVTMDFDDFLENTGLCLCFRDALKEG